MAGMVGTNDPETSTNDKYSDECKVQMTGEKRDHRGDESFCDAMNTNSYGNYHTWDETSPRDDGCDDSLISRGETFVDLSVLVLSGAIWQQRCLFN